MYARSPMGCARGLDRLCAGAPEPAWVVRVLRGSPDPAHRLCAGLLTPHLVRPEVSQPSSRSAGFGRPTVGRFDGVGDPRRTQRPRSARTLTRANTTTETRAEHRSETRAEHSDRDPRRTQRVVSMRRHRHGNRPSPMAHRAWPIAHGRWLSSTQFCLAFPAIFITAVRMPAYGQRADSSLTFTSPCERH